MMKNTIKFTPEGGSVTITATQRRDMVQILVADTGIGIAKEDLDKLFQPFKQLDSSQSRQYQGTGLGLALVKQFVELHGGEVWVESKVGEGSTFTFTLPLSI
ncbi:MAG: ATP-binding protein [Euryarchaeota archaeon]|nr:ATP-binding protein [Euryarchaeota archaeon]